MSNKICPQCEEYACYGDICTRCKEKNRLATLRKIKIKMPCKHCGDLTETNRVKEGLHKKKGGIVCKKCCSKLSSITMKQTRSKETTEEKRQRGANANKIRTKESFRKGTIKQWETIRSDPEKWSRMQNQRSRQGKISWDNQTDEQKEKRLKKWLNPKSRSKVSERLKNEMIKNGVYDGFESEQVFHGFIPDEINHELKIIVEMYGDLYHCNPRKYKNPDLYLKTIRRTVGEQWERDRRRLGCFYKHGYTVVIVWEKDFYNNSAKQIERVKDEINKQKKDK